MSLMDPTIGEVSDEQRAELYDWIVNELGISNRVPAAKDLDAAAVLELLAKMIVRLEEVTGAPIPRIN
jgi:hypothetical protein